MPDLTPFIQKLIMNGVKAEMLGKPSDLCPSDGRATQGTRIRPVQVVEQTQHFTLIKVKGKWRVDLNVPY